MTRKTEKLLKGVWQSTFFVLVMPEEARYRVEIKELEGEGVTNFLKKSS